MVIISYILFLAFFISVSVGFYHSHTVKTEKPIALQNSASDWADFTDSIATTTCVLWVIGVIWTSSSGIAFHSTAISPLTSILIAISILQRSGRAMVWRIIGYGLLLISLAGLMGMISGCSTTKYSDPVQPAGAITVNVPVPTCDDNLAKTLFVVNHRPKVLPINELTDADKRDHEIVSKAYIETIQLLTSYAVSLERDRAAAQMQCTAIRQQVDTLNTKTPVIAVPK